MYVSFVFLGYIFAVFLALIGIALIVLVVMKNRVETTERFKSIRNFSVSILLISVLYFFNISIMKPSEKCNLSWKQINIFPRKY